MNAEDLFPIASAAKHTEMSEPCIRRGLKNGTIRGVKMGRDWFVIPSEVARLAAEYPLNSRELEGANA